ncbi:MAG: DUF11 domain-containing protein [Deltaproteobacteria bacterium]|nr:DUF11 domain-containing protein [Deltaproteobacteria bacterium]
MNHLKRCFFAMVISIVLWFSIALDDACAIQFNFVPDPGTPQEAIDGFEAAGVLWSDLLEDDITINVEIFFQPLSPSVVGSTSSEEITVTYPQYQTALQQDILSEQDMDAWNNLQSGSLFELLINRTSDSPHGSGNGTPYLDNNGNENNATIRLTRANAKALGLLAANDPDLDARIGFSTQFNWFFGGNVGIGSNEMNFVFVAAHEIGHALGFVSGVDILDINSPPAGGPFPESLFIFVSPPDTFRFSSESVTHGNGVIDWTADNRAKNFSIDGGTINLGGFSLGQEFGDGRQASHWKDNLGLGLMDPTTAAGETHTITPLDISLFDVIGYDLFTSEPVAISELSITKDDPQATVNPGQSISCEFTITNHGPDSATGATITYTLPDGASFVSSTSSSCSNNGDTAVCSIGNIAEGESKTTVMTVSVSSSAEEGAMTIIASVEANESDTNDLNNTVTVITQIEAGSSITTLEVFPPLPLPTNASISTPGEEDLFEFVVNTARRYTIETGGNTDTYMSLFGQNNMTTPIMENDDIGGGNLNSRISRSLDPGTYIVQIRGFSSAIVGPYVVSVQSER